MIALKLSGTLPIYLSHWWLLSPLDRTMSYMSLGLIGIFHPLVAYNMTGDTSSLRQDARVMQEFTVPVIDNFSRSRQIDRRILI